MSPPQLVLDAPDLATILSLDRPALLAMAAELDVAADVLNQLRGAVRTLLHEGSPPPALLEAKEAARRLGVSVDYVRDHGNALGIAVPLDGLTRYDPEAVEALRRRRATATGVTLR